MAGSMSGQSLRHSNSQLLFVKSALTRISEPRGGHRSVAPPGGKEAASKAQATWCVLRCPRHPGVPGH